MKYNIFPTFAEAVEAQNYDHLFQKALGFATASGVEFNLIRELNLHIKNEAGELPLDKYIVDHNIILEDKAIYQFAKNYWEITTAWATIFKYGENYVYRKDHSDINYTIIELENDATLSRIDENGNIIENIIDYDLEC